MIKVFIAEDDFRIADIHEKFLNNIEGVQVIGKALTAEETLKRLKTERVDLLLLDIYMPDKLGTDLIKELRKHNLNHISVIVITAAKQKEFFEETITNGIYHYLIKPVSIEKFKEVIERFKQQKELLNQREYVDQEFIDEYLKVNSRPKEEQASKAALPKGIDPLTLNKVIKIIEGCSNGISAEEMGVKMGASRTTARRYLEYLISIGKVRAELEYGIVGRPERRYYS